jgi:hypothetical protein
MKLLLISVFFASYLTYAEDVKAPIKVMSYNVENLFDLEHDEDKNDWEFLAKDYPGKFVECNKMSNSSFRKRCLEGDWKEINLNIKLDQIKKIVHRSGSAPDILAVVEIENQNVGNLLANKLGYKKVIVTDSPDERGVDVALFFNEKSNLKYVSHREISVSTQSNQTRNVLEVVFKVNSEYLHYFVNHWPSQSNPVSDRLYAAKIVKKEVDKIMQMPGHHAVMSGDFNTVNSDKPNPISDVVLADNSIEDLNAKFLADTSIPTSIKNACPNGTYFYFNDRAWNLLDRFLVMKSLFQGKTLKVKPADYRIACEAFASKPVQLNGESVMAPWRYWHNAYTASHAGFSDHYAIEMELSF